MEVPMTFADFAITEIRFRKHFRLAPPDTWNENMMPLAEFLELAKDEREGRFPFVWSIDRHQNLTRLLVAEAIVASCEDRRDFWTMLKALAHADEKPVDREAIESEVRKEMTSRIAAGIMQIAVGGDAEDVTQTLEAINQTDPANGNHSGSSPASDGQYMAPWIDTDQCTSCDECINLNSKIFQYNENKKAVIKNPLGGPYQDLVKAAERCTARVIHPGLPKNHGAKDIEKWIARGTKYN
jgi:pyruvate-ferredoxin/flavodoxin oxidoreductase